MRAGGVLLILLALLALLGPAIQRESPTAQHRENIYEPPSFSRHLLGTDGLGRDVLARSLHAARFTFATAFAGVVLVVLVGGAAGAAAGLLGGFPDRLIMRATELTMALPALYLILAIRNLFPDSIGRFTAAFLIVLSLAALGWSGVARLVRGQVLSIREEAYVASARAAGASRLRLVAVHILGVLRPFLLLQVGLYLPYFLLGEVTLSYMGLGLAEPDPSFGNMLASALRDASFLGRRYWLWVPPAGLLTLAVLGSNLWIESLRARYAGSSERAGFVSWAVRASRLWSSSMWGSKHLRQRAS
ncbi:MAG TPA: ABC transporter permease [Vicinamibacteria bacterium]|nr:ABC transporter permease [Vicinamibacteria bacterium]